MILRILTHLYLFYLLNASDFAPSIKAKSYLIAGHSYCHHRLNDDLILSIRHNSIEKKLYLIFNLFCVVIRIYQVVLVYFRLDEEFCLQNVKQ